VTAEPPAPERAATELPAPGLAGRLDLPPGLRVAVGGYVAEFGQPPATVWQVPGTITLLANGPLRLTVAAPWGTIAAAGPQAGDAIELVKMERPGERERLTVREAAAGAGPRWAGTALRAADGGATLLVKSELPEGSGADAGAAAETAIRLCLGGPASPGFAAGCALAGSRRLPFDLAAAGLRLVLIDTRVRGEPCRAPAESSPVTAAAAAISAGDITAVGPLMTAAHASLACDDVQEIAVSVALRAGAIGARMITDGPGRPACALVPASCVAGLRAAVSDWFAWRGLRPPRFLTFTPAGGPQRLWPIPAGKDGPS
jgi:galactokinase